MYHQEGPLAVSLLLNMSGRKQSGPKALRRSGWPATGVAFTWVLGQFEMRERQIFKVSLLKLGFEIIYWVVALSTFSVRKTASFAACCSYNTNLVGYSLASPNYSIVFPKFIPQFRRCDCYIPQLSHILSHNYPTCLSNPIIITRKHGISLSSPSS